MAGIPESVVDVARTKASDMEGLSQDDLLAQMSIVLQSMNEGNHSVVKDKWHLIVDN